MGPAVGALVGKRGRGANVSAALLERKTVDKVNILHVIFRSKLCFINKISRQFSFHTIN